MIKLTNSNLWSSLQRAIGGDPTAKLERALEFIQNEGYDLVLDGAQFEAGDSLALQLAARRLASHLHTARAESPSGVDIKNRSSLAQRLAFAVREWSAQWLGWHGGPGGVASQRALRVLEDVSGEEVIRLAQRIRDGSEELLSLTSGEMQQAEGPVRGYHGLRFKSFAFGKWSISVNLLAEVSPRSFLDEQQRRQRELGLRSDLVAPGKR